MKIPLTLIVLAFVVFTSFGQEPFKRVYQFMAIEYFENHEKSGEYNRRNVFKFDARTDVIHINQMGIRTKYTRTSEIEHLEHADGTGFIAFEVVSKDGESILFKVYDEEENGVQMIRGYEEGEETYATTFINKD